MQRDLSSIESETYDVVVVGGGIYGAAICREAALRGLRVALLEKADFGASTSANSLKIIHGGLRYLQNLNLPLARRMARERSFWLRAAPHLVRPLPFLLPTSRTVMRHQQLLRVALKLNDWLSWDRNQALDSEQHLPDGTVLAPVAGGDLIAGTKVTGVARWFDGQIYSSERLLLAVLHAADAAGARLANHVNVQELLTISGRVAGLVARDEQTGRRLDIRANAIVNATGHEADTILDHSAAESGYQPSLAFNLLLHGRLADQAIALGAGETGDTLFLVPWRDNTLLGTIHLTAEGQSHSLVLSEEMLARLLAHVNRSCPAASFDRDDLLQIYWGYLPVKQALTTRTRLLRQSVIVNHGERDGLSGLYTILGVKYTTARRTAELIVDQLGESSAPEDVSMSQPLFGGNLDSVAAVTEGINRRFGEYLCARQINHLVCCYGSEAETVAGLLTNEPALARPVADFAETCLAQFKYALRHEMAQGPGDLVRRLGLDLGRKEVVAGMATYRWPESLRTLERTAAAWLAARPADSSR